MQILGLKLIKCFDLLWFTVDFLLEKVETRSNFATTSQLTIIRVVDPNILMLPIQTFY